MIIHDKNDFKGKGQLIVFYRHLSNHTNNDNNENQRSPVFALYKNSAKILSFQYFVIFGFAQKFKLKP
jgi:hypothetical protein